jgi:DNA invertase Pin-like site-specific DNA recombinase
MIQGALMTTKFGYARVSATDQDLGVQLDALKRAGCDVLRSEKVSGTTTRGFAELATLLELVREGDVLVVTRIDRLARSIGDLQGIVRALSARGATLHATEQPIDTSAAAGKCFLDMLGIFAQFETDLRRERQLEGIAKAKAAGVYKGRPPKLDEDRIHLLHDQEKGPSEIARALRMGRASFYRIMNTGDRYGVHTYTYGKLNPGSRVIVEANSHREAAERVYGNTLVEAHSIRERKLQDLTAKAWKGADVRWFFTA